ncbi:MAG: SDR family oxidoreductase, partial [Pseudomonadota bacterium]
MNNPTGTGQLHNKTAVVTGGSRGIGRAIIEAFISEGARVVTSSRNAPDSDLPEAVHWLQADVSDPTQVDALAEFAVGQLGNIDILVNNAGVQLEKTVVNSTDADWNQLMGTNAHGVFLVCRRFIPIMTASGGGSIINIGSISGEHADPTMALYNASKAFVAGLTRSIAVDHGAE